MILTPAQQLLMDISAAYARFCTPRAVDSVGGAKNFEALTKIMTTVIEAIAVTMPVVEADEAKDRARRLAKVYIGKVPGGDQ